jgi:hypothetical protein
MCAERMHTCRLLLIAMTLAGCRPEGARTSAGQAGESAFAGVQARGAVAMGVNQFTSRHIFEPLPDGGRIELQREATDSAGSAQIRRHMQLIAVRFAAGDFALPGFVHARGVPGTQVMAARRAAIAYTVDTLPRGAALRLRSGDSTAIEAIHAFLAFQRQDHHAGAHRDS